MTTLVLRHFNPTLLIIVESDASDFAITAIISQVDPAIDKVHLVTFHACTMISTELNYNIYDKELLAIHEAF
jgi:hypothetical protein